MLGNMQKKVCLKGLGDVSFFDINPFHTWVLVLQDKTGFIWVSDHFFPTMLDAFLWGTHVRDVAILCVRFHAIRLIDILTSQTVAESFITYNMLKS